MDIANIKVITQNGRPIVKIEYFNSYTRSSPIGLKVQKAFTEFESFVKDENIMVGVGSDEKKTRDKGLDIYSQQKPVAVVPRHIDLFDHTANNPFEEDEDKDLDPTPTPIPKNQLQRDEHMMTVAPVGVTTTKVTLEAPTESVEKEGKTEKAVKAEKKTSKKKVVAEGL